MNLGQKRPSGPLATSPSKDEPKETFPGFTLNDKIADAFLKEYKCDLGDEITAKVTLKVSSLRKDEYGNSVGFEMRALDDTKVIGGEDEKILGYKPKKKSEAPDTSEADDSEDAAPKAGADKAADAAPATAAVPKTEAGKSTDSSGADSSSEVHSPTKTSTETSTSTDAYTARNITVTGGAGAGNTVVKISPAADASDEAETKALGYKRASKAEAPDTSEADI